MLTDNTGKLISVDSGDSFIVNEKLYTLKELTVKINYNSLPEFTIIVFYTVFDLTSTKTNRGECSLIEFVELYNEYYYKTEDC